MKQIKIGGGGIAGLTAAINLAKAGYKVIVFEKHKEVSGCHHGDFEGIENWTTKEDALKVIKRFNIDLIAEEPRQLISFQPWRQVTIFDSQSKRYDKNGLGEKSKTSALPSSSI